MEYEEDEGTVVMSVQADMRGELSAGLGPLWPVARVLPALPSPRVKRVQRTHGTTTTMIGLAKENVTCSKTSLSRQNPSGHPI